MNKNLRHLSSFQYQIQLIIFCRYQFENPFYIPTKAGDCVLFDVRLLHKGEQHRGDRYSIFTAMGTDNEFSKNHAKGAIDRQLRQNFQEEYVLQPYLKNMLKDLNIVY